MQKNVRLWLEEMKKAPVKKALPVLSFPAIQIMDITVKELISDSDLQAKGMKLIADRVDAAASVSLIIYHWKQNVLVLQSAIRMMRFRL